MSDDLKNLKTNMQHTIFLIEEPHFKTFREIERDLWQISQDGRINMAEKMITTDIAERLNVLLNEIEYLCKVTHASGPRKL